MEQSNPIGTKELEIYESICDLSEKMLSVAKRGDWDAITSIEKKRTRLISTVQTMTTQSLSENEETTRKVDLIQRILSADAMTKVFVQERMKLLKKGFHTERKLLNTYKQKVLS